MSDTSGLLKRQSHQPEPIPMWRPTQHNVSIVRVDDLVGVALTTAPRSTNEQVMWRELFPGGAFVRGRAANAVRRRAGLFQSGWLDPARVLDDGGANTTDVNALSVTQTATALAQRPCVVAEFTDGSNP